MSPEQRPSFADLKQKFLADKNIFEKMDGSQFDNSQYQASQFSENRQSFRAISNSVPQTPQSNLLPKNFQQNSVHSTNAQSFKNSPHSTHFQNYNNSNSANQQFNLGVNQPLLQQQSSPSSQRIESAGFEPAPSSHYTNITRNDNSREGKLYQAPAPSHNGLLSYHTLSDG